MLPTLLRLVFIFHLVVTVFSIRYSSIKHKSKPTYLQDDSGAPLLLSPMIEAGQLNEAKDASSTNILNIKGYSGFITVNKTYNSNMFFWYFPAKNGDSKAPLLLWLQGGPGATSMFGLFGENGPYTVDEKHEIQQKKISWVSEYNVVYVDNPVGTGYSFTSNDSGYSTNEVDVGENLYKFMQQFYQLFTELQSVPFYVTGESYAGKYVPALAYKIHVENEKATLKIPLTGLIIGGGFCDPESMFPAYADHMYNVGLLDEYQRDHMSAGFAEAVEKIRSKDLIGAFKIFDLMLNGDLTPYPTYFFNSTGGHNYFNYLTTEEPKDYDYWENYLDKPEIRKATHVGNATSNDGRTVENHLMADIPDTVKPWIIQLLDSGNYSVLFYNGQLDIIVGHPLTERFLWNLEWSGLGDYRVADRQVWKIDKDDVEVAGYFRKAGKLVQALVRGAGHISPYDQPERTLDLINRFTRGKL